VFLSSIEVIKIGFPVSVYFPSTANAIDSPSVNSSKTLIFSKNALNEASQSSALIST